jgi:hypothetical protein
LVGAGWYRTCVIDAVLEHFPAEHVRRPNAPTESPALGFTHLQFEALLAAAREPSWLPGRPSGCPLPSCEVPAGDGAGVLMGRFGCRPALVRGCGQYLDQVGGRGAAACYREDTEDMNRERAETHLRLLAEAELRRAATWPADGGLLEECHSARLELVAQALHAVRAFDMGAANEIQAELALALGVRQPGQRPGGLAPNAEANLNRLTLGLPRPSAGHHRPPRPHAPWRVMPVGQVIRTRAGDVQGELHLLAYAQTAAGARFTAVGYRDPGQVPERHRPPPGVLLAHQITAVDDQGTSYQFSASLGPVHAEWSGVLDLRPDPPHEIRWLDLSTAPGQPATRIDLNSRQARQARPAPQEITVTPAAVSSGELLLTGIATGFLALASPEQVPLHPSAARPGPLSQAADGLADIIATMHAAAELSPSSRLPGQLAGLCARLGISGHGIAAPPTADLPEPWLSLLTYCHRGEPARAPVPGWAVTAIELPELDGARVTVLGLHNGEHGQFLHLLASGITPEYTWPYGTIANRMPVVWLRDRNDRWHIARPARSAPWRDTDDFLLWLRVVPPLDHGTPWIDVVAAGPSAEVRARLPLSWNCNP